MSAEVNGAFDPLEFSDDFDTGTTVLVRILYITGIATRAITLVAQAMRNVFISGTAVKMEDIESEATKIESITGSILDVEDKKLYDQEIDP